MSPFMNRITPALPAQAYKTYQIVEPRSTHFRRASCDEAGCRPYVEGWQSGIDESTEQGQAQAYYIRHDSGRRFTESTDLMPGLTVFTFEPGQACFKADEHRTRVGRPELLFVKGGDWRGNPMGTPARQHVRAEHWLEDFAGHQQMIADRHKRG